MQTYVLHYIPLLRPHVYMLNEMIPTFPCPHMRNRKNWRFPSRLMFLKVPGCTQQSYHVLFIKCTVRLTYIKGPKICRNIH